MMPFGPTWNIEWNYQTFTPSWPQELDQMLTFCSPRSQIRPCQPIENAASTISPKRRTSERGFQRQACKGCGKEPPSSDEWVSKWKTQLNFNLIKFNYCDACFRLLRQPRAPFCFNHCLVNRGRWRGSEKLADWREWKRFSFVSRKNECGDWRMKCNYFWAQIPSKQLLWSFCSTSGSAPTPPEERRREWYNETLNSAYNLGKNFFFCRLLVLRVGKVIHWENYGRGWCRGGGVGVSLEWMEREDRFRRTATLEISFLSIENKFRLRQSRFFRAKQ